MHTLARSDDEVIERTPDDDLATILIVDDDDNDIQLALSNLFQLSHLKCNIIIAKSGHEAFAILRSQTIDLVLLDINMPGQNGFEVLRQILHAELTVQSIPVIICSSSRLDSTKGLSKLLGAYDYITKPLDITKLRKTIAKIEHLHMVEMGNDLVLQRLAQTN